jgi:hypothetical protein
MPSSQPSTHTPTIYSQRWTAKTPSTVSCARQSYMQLRNTSPHSFLFSPGRMEAGHRFSCEWRHTAPPQSSPPAP